MAKASRLCSVVISQCMSYGLKPNMKPGKTALLLKLRGAGVQKVQGHYFRHGRRALHLQDVDMDISVTCQYKHLGGVVDHNAGGGCEAKRRLAIAAAAYEKGRDLLYLNATIPLKTRADLMQLAVTTTMHNLALWVPEGLPWAQLCQGYARLVRRLLMKECDGEALLHTPSVYAHVSTGTPPLFLVARKARLSLLASMARTAPMALWAALQEEQSWLRAVHEDLAWLREGSEDQWPQLGAAHWPAWRSLLGQATAWYKRQVARRVRIENEAYAKDQKMKLALWAIYRRASAVLPDRWEPATRLVCRPCGKTFKTKGALGAHFQKSHGRCAKYRAVVVGTVCRACGVQYWTTGRLSRHMRDTPQCVSTLYDSGHRAPVIAPGVGSRARRESDIDDFHPAAPQRACTPVEQSVDDYWDDVQKAAHAELCDMLLVPTLIPSWTATLGAIQAVLAKFPLYYEEARDIANFVKSEVVAVGPELLEEFWTPEVKSAVEQALETFVEQEWPLPEGAKGPRQPPPTFEDSKGEIPEYDWPHLVLKVTALYGTRPPSAWTLPSDWEAEWSKSSAEVSSSAVQGRLWAWVPENAARSLGCIP